MYTALIPNHEYKEEALHYPYHGIKRTIGSFLGFRLWEEDIYPDKVGCICGKDKEDRIHKPLRLDRF